MATTTRDKKVAACRVEEVHDSWHGWAVKSPSGKTYRVTSTTHLDEMGCMFFRLHCSCPARKRCVHMDAVQTFRCHEAVANNDYADMDMLERVEL